jgi:transglutaminase-like putative cysteine protease
MLKGHAWIEVVSDGNRFVVDPTGGIATDNKAFIEEEYDKKYPVR